MKVFFTTNNLCFVGEPNVMSASYARVMNPTQLLLTSSDNICDVINKGWSEKREKLLVDSIELHNVALVADWVHT